MLVTFLSSIRHNSVQITINRHTREAEGGRFISLYLTSSNEFLGTDQYMWDSGRNEKFECPCLLPSSKEILEAPLLSACSLSLCLNVYRFGTRTLGYYSQMHVLKNCYWGWILPPFQGLSWCRFFNLQFSWIFQSRRPDASAHGDSALQGPGSSPLWRSFYCTSCSILLFRSCGEHGSGPRSLNLSHQPSPWD